MDKDIDGKLLIAMCALLISLASGTGIAGAWGTTSYQSSGWSSSGTSLDLNLTIADCAKCHTGSNPDRHHALMVKSGKQCLDCHQMTADPTGQYTVQVVRDCQVCHQPSVHDTVRHDVKTCSSCHGSDVIRIHGGWGYSSSSTLSVCFKCHTSTVPAVRQTIAAGVAGQAVACTDCHGNNPHRWGGSWGR